MSRTYRKSWENDNDRDGSISPRYRSKENKFARKTDWRSYRKKANQKLRTDTEAVLENHTRTCGWNTH